MTLTEQEAALRAAVAKPPLTNIASLADDVRRAIYAAGPPDALEQVLHNAFDALHAEIDALRAAMTNAVEIIKDSWGLDQIEAGDDQACNVLMTALNKEPTK
jgi:hypothetical protein